MSIGISAVGLATAQGNAAEILSGAPPRKASRIPWTLKPETRCPICRPVLGLDWSLSGIERWQRLAQMAVADCLNGKPLRPETPVVVASGNGAAFDFALQDWENAFDSRILLNGTPWANPALPIISGACASGFHALYLAARLLESGCEEAFVLGADILSPANHANFEALRVLSSEPAPWRRENSGFVPGEAAVALRLTKGSGERGYLSRPVLNQDGGQNEGIRNVLAAVSNQRVQLIIGQGSGPAEIDQLELAALGKYVPRQIPLTTPLLHFGHTNGTSGLLSIALAVLRQGASTGLPSLCMEAPKASDGRPLLAKAPRGVTLVLGRALSGACAAATVLEEAAPTACRKPVAKSWRASGVEMALSHPLLRKLACEAREKRAPIPPDLLVVRLGKPIVPRREARIGGKLLPSAILEITPGFMPQLISHCWGFSGAALCLVGDGSTEAAGDRLIQACRGSGLRVCLVQIRGDGEKRHVDWNV